MIAGWKKTLAPHAGAHALAVLIVIAVIGSLLLTSYRTVNFDVAFLAWAAGQVAGGAVYGRDILDVSPPLCMLIYMPAVFLAPAVGLEWGIRIWMLLITVLSVATLWQTADRAVRFPVAVTLLAFVLLAYPNEFAQREQIALLLCAPYVAGAARSKGWAAVSGLMAGVGFLMKPYFLLPLLLVFALRRRMRTEEYAILAAGTGYALVLILFFQAYLFEMVPRAAITYGAISYPEFLLQQLVIIGCLAGLMAVLAAPQAEARAYLAAAAGFTAAAFLQQKGFFYHFIPAFGFLTIYTVITLRNRRLLAARLAAVLLLLQTALYGALVVRRFWALHTDRQMTAELNREIDNSSSYAALLTQPAGAWPHAIHTSSRFVGIAIAQIFVPAVIAHQNGANAAQPDPAERLALDQAITEISRKPDLVLLNQKNHNGDYFDLLGFYMKDETFRTLWKDYWPTRIIGGVVVFRRRDQ